jgi:hypothetical protein
MWKLDMYNTLCPKAVPVIGQQQECFAFKVIECCESRWPIYDVVLGEEKQNRHDGGRGNTSKNYPTSRNHPLLYKMMRHSQALRPTISFVAFLVLAITTSFEHIPFHSLVLANELVEPPEDLVVPLQAAFC